MYFVRDCVLHLCPELWCRLIVSEILVIVMCNFIKVEIIGCMLVLYRLLDGLLSELSTDMVMYSLSPYMMYFE